MNSYQHQRCLEERINFFVRFFGTTLILFGLATIIAQVVKFFVEGGGNYGMFLGVFIGFIFILLGSSKITKYITKKAIFSKKNTFKIAFFSFPFCLNLIVLTIIYNVGLESWEKMDTEGGIIEYATSIAYILGFIFALQIGKLFIDKNRNILGFYYYLLAGFCLFIGLEELSWGQRFIGVQSPDFFENYNSKSELSLHNLVWLESYLYFGFIILGAWGGMSWLIVRLIDKKKQMSPLLYRYLFPSWFISSFFLIVFCYFFILQYVSQWEIIMTPIKECMELTLSLGFFWFVMISFFRQPFDFDV